MKRELIPVEVPDVEHCLQQAVLALKSRKWRPSDKPKLEASALQYCQWALEGYRHEQEEA